MNSFNPFIKNPELLGLERWLGGQKHWLLFQRIQVRIPAPTGPLKLSVTLVPQDTMPSSGPSWARGIHAGKTPTHIKLKEKENPEQTIEKTWHVLQ